MPRTIWSGAIDRLTRDDLEGDDFATCCGMTAPRSIITNAPDATRSFAKDVEVRNRR